MLRRKLLLTSFLLATSFIGYFATRALIAELTKSSESNESIWVSGTYYSAIIIFSLLGAILSRRIERIRMLRFWMILGCVASIVPFLFSNGSVLDLSIMALLLGASFGIGMPSCLAFFAESTDFRNRGKASGVTFLATNLGAFILTLLSNDTKVMLGVTLALRIVGLCALLTSENIPSSLKEAGKSGSFRSVLQNRTFLLYIMPWLTFYLIDKLERSYFEIFFEPSFFDFMSVVEPAVGMIFVLVGGLLADRIGRKRVLIYGFVALGVGYASIGLAPYMDISRYFYTFVDGVAWGIFMVVYMLIIWGDLSVSSGAAEKYYTLGSIPFFLVELVMLFLNPYVQQIPGASAYAIFSLASFFLFLAVIPLMFAPETLPEKNIKERELKEYIEKAKKTKEKYA
jgi:MFS family permease